ncbi:MAG: cobalt-precorrin-6A reductase [Pseudomonadota bacterium]
MTLLLLAGTREAREIAQRAQEDGITAVASLAGATREPTPLALPTRIGGFGGAPGFQQYVADHNISAVLDATHPFAHRISERTARLCAALGLPYCQLLRPPWPPEPDWLMLEREEDLAPHVRAGETVFLATGRQTLDRFADLAHARVICRQIDPPDAPFPFPNGAYHVARPPFSQADEEALFTRLGVDWLVAKNAGGPAARAKLDAADRLGLRVALLARPPQPPGDKVRDVAEALIWMRAQ